MWQACDGRRADSHSLMLIGGVLEKDGLFGASAFSRYRYSAQVIYNVILLPTLLILLWERYTIQG